MRRLRLNLRKDSGWTFIETLITISIVLVLSTVVGIVGIQMVDKSRLVAAQSQIKVYSLALNAYYLDNGNFPSEEQGLKALWEKPSIDPQPKRWTGPYVDQPTTQDPWGTEWIYAIPGPSGLPFHLLSYGSDGKEGGDGTATDISSVQP